MKSSISKQFVWAVLLAIFVASCGTLDPAGIYKGDKALYAQDVSIATAYDVMHMFVLWEYQNRKLLTGTPKIKEYADSIRVGAQKWINSAIAMRDAYALNPNPQTQAAMEKAYAVLREAVNQATMYMAQSVQSPQPK